MTTSAFDGTHDRPFTSQDTLWPVPSHPSSTFVYIIESFCFNQGVNVKAEGKGNSYLENYLESSTSIMFGESCNLERPVLRGLRLYLKA